MALLQEYDKRQQLLQPTVQAINSMLGLPSCIWLLDKLGKTLRIAAAAKLFDEYVRDAYLQLDEPCVAAEVFEKKRTVIISDINIEKQWKYREQALNMGLQSAIVIPLWVKRKIVGILDLYIPENVDFDYNTNIPAIEDFAVQIGVTLRQVQGLETLNEVGSLMNLEIKDFHNLLERIMQAAQKVLAGEHVSIFLVENDELIRKASSSSAVKRERFKLGEGLAGQVAQEGQPLLVPNTRKYPNFLPGLSSGIKERSMLLVPIILFIQSQKQVIGVISADSDEINGFDLQDQLFMETLSKQTAIAIHNFQLFESEHKRREELERLRKIEQSVSSQTDLEKVVGTVLDELKNVVEYNRASVQIIRGDHRFIIGARGFLLEKTSPKLLRNVSEDTLICKIVQNREIYVLSDVNKEPLWHHIPETGDVHSWICAPLIVGDQVIGLLTIDHPETGHYSEKDGEKVARFANQVAAEIHKSNFFQTIRNQAQALTELNKLTYELLSLREIIDIKKLLQKIADTAKEVLKADLIGLYEYHQDWKIFDLPPIFAGQMYVAPDPKKEIAKDAAVFQFVNQQTPVYVDNTQKDPIFSTPYTIPREGELQEKERFAIREKIQSTAVIPLRAGDETLGLMFANYRTPQTFSVEQREIIQLFANQAAIVIQNARFFARLNAINQRQKALIKVGEDLTSKIELQEQDILQLLEVQARVALGIENLTVALYDEQTEMIRFVQASRDGKPVKVEEEPGWEPHPRGKGGRGKTEWIIEHKEPLLLSSPDEIKKWGFSPDPGDLEYTGPLPNSWLGVPMLLGERVVGVITTYHYGRNQVFTKDDIDVLRALADQAVIALDNARVIQRQKALIEVGKDLASKIELQEQDILQLLEAQARVALGIENLTVTLYDEQTEMIRFVQASRDGKPVNVEEERGWEPHPRGKGGRGKTEWIIEHKESLLLSSPDEIKKWGFSPDPGDLEYTGPLPNSWLGVPMVLGEKVLGVITTYHYERDLVFAKDDIDVLWALADQAVIALQNARLYNELSKERNMLRTLIDNIPAHVYAKDTHSRFMLANKIVADVLGVKSQEDLIGKTDFDFQEEALAQQYRADELQVLKGEPLINREERFINQRTNAEQWLLTTKVPLKDAQGEIIGLVGINRDITELKQAEEELRKHRDHLEELVKERTKELEREITERKQAVKIQETLYKISEAAHTAKNLEEIYPAIHKIVANLMPAKNFYIASYDETTKALNFPYHIDEHDPTPSSPAPKEFLKGVTGYVLRTGQPLLASSKEYEKLLRKGEIEVVEERAVDWLGVPLKSQEKTIGVLAVQSYTEDVRYREPDKDILTFVSDQIAAAIERVQAEAREEELIRCQRALIGLGQTLTSELQLKEVEILKLIHEHASDVMDTANMYIALYDEKSERIRFGLVFENGEQINTKADETWEPRKLNEGGKTEWIVNNRKPLLLKTHSEAEAWYEHPEHKKHSGTKIRPSWMGVPMMLGEQVLGVIAIHHDTEDNVYDEDDRDVLLSIANQAAIAIRNARLYEGLELQVEERTNKLTALIELAQTLNSRIQLSEHEICDLIHRYAAEVMDTNNMYIALYDELADTIRFGLVMVDGEPINIAEREEYQPRKFQRDEIGQPKEMGKTEAIIYTKKSLFHPTQASSEEWYKQPGHKEFWGYILPSWMGVPMMIGDKVLGVIATYHSTEEYKYSQKDLEILESMANSAAIALNNARLIRELEHAQRKIAESETVLTRTSIAADFVHRLNNLAGTIPIWVDQIREYLGPKLIKDKTLSEYLNSIESNTDGLLRAAEELKSLPKEQNVDLQLILESLIRKTRVQFPTKINVHLEYIEKLPVIKAVSSELSNALWILIQNGLEAMPDGGTLNIEAKRIIDTKGREGVEILISDTGIGIPQEEISKLFSPFYSTKVGHMGYGLWRARQVFERIGGDINFKSQEGQGSTFSVKLPGFQEVVENE